MDQLNRARTGTAPLRPLTGQLPALAPQSAPGGKIESPIAPPQDHAGVAVGELGLEVRPKPLTEVNIPATAGRPTFYNRAQSVLADAMAATARVVKNSASLASDRTFLQRVKPIFSKAGNETLEKLSDSGKLSAVDRHMRTLRGVVANLLRTGANAKLLEVINNQALHPDAIEQIPGKTTCPTAVFQKTLAEGNPGGYAKAAFELLTSGKTTLPDGTALSISAANKSWIEAQNLPTSRKINALFQVALAEAVVKPDVYDVASDTVIKDEEIEETAAAGVAATGAGAGVMSALAAVGTQVAKLPFGPFMALGKLSAKLKARFKQRKKVRESGGLDFYKVLRFYKQQGTPAFDPRSVRFAKADKRAEALRDAFEKARSSGRGLSIPVHSDVGATVRYHMVQVVDRDANGNYTVHDPQTGKRLSYTEKQFMDLVAWDIRSGSNVGGGRIRKGSGGGGEV